MESKDHVCAQVRKEGTLPLCPEGTDYIMTKKGYFDDAGFYEDIKFLNAEMEGAHI